MKWQKKGLICSHETLDLPWFKKNIMVPVPYLLDDERIRIFVSLCDENNVGRIGYIDVKADNPSVILDYAKNPVLGVGEDGTFDDNGVITASAVKVDGLLRLYYSGYELYKKVPYKIFCGMATSDDDGRTFVRYSTVPLMDRTAGEKISRAAPILVKNKDKYQCWYTADVGSGITRDKNGKILPNYVVKYTESDDGVHFDEGKQCLYFASDDEFGLAKPTIWNEDGLYKMIYSIRSFSKGYRLGYAESENGVDFVRLDDKVGIDVSETGWDSEMQCFASRFVYKDKVYLFYCGNKYGQSGMGYAELAEK